MESQYLKQSLAKLATLKARSEEIDSKENRERTRTQYSLQPGGEYPAMCGQFMGLIMGAHWDIESATRSAERLEVIDREHERLVTILEGLDIDLDEEALAALEVLAKNSHDYKSERRELASAINKAIRETQESERQIEQDDATEKLAAAGFVLDDEHEAWNRNREQVRIELTNGRESRYKWEYETSEPLHQIETGISGDFARLLALITPSQSASASTVTETPTERKRRHERECGGTMHGVGAPDPESCAEFTCDNCDYVHNVNDEVVIGRFERVVKP